MGTIAGSTYVVEAANELHDRTTVRQPYLTNRPTGKFLVFTNRLPLLPQRYFRARLP